MPLSAVTGRAELFEKVQPSGLGDTYGGNPVSYAAALAAIETMQEWDLNARALRIEEIVTVKLTIADSIARPSPRITLRISSSPTRGNPLAIIRGYGELNRRQSAVLEQLPEFGSRAIV